MSNSLRPHESQHTRPHQLPEFTQTHVHRVSDAIQPSHPLSSPSPPAPNPSKHHGLFQWVNSSHEVAKVLEFQLQHQSFQWTPRTGLLYNGLVGSPCSPRDFQESSPAPLFKSINSLVLSFLHSPTLTSIHNSCQIQGGLVLTSMKSLLWNPQNRLDLSYNFYHNLKLKYLIILDIEIPYTLQICLWTLTVEFFISKQIAKE